MTLTLLQFLGRNAIEQSHKSMALIKGTVSRDGYFYCRSIYYNHYRTGTFCVCGNGFQGLSKAFSQLNNSEMHTKNPPHNFLRSDWSIFPSVDPSLAAEKMRKN